MIVILSGFGTAKDLKEVNFLKESNIAKSNIVLNLQV